MIYKRGVPIHGQFGRQWMPIWVFRNRPCPWNVNNGYCWTSGHPRAATDLYDQLMASLSVKKGIDFRELINQVIAIT